MDGSLGDGPGVPAGRKVCVLLAVLFLLHQWFFEMLMMEGPEHHQSGFWRAHCVQGFFGKSFPQGWDPWRPPLCLVFSPPASAHWGPALPPLPTIADSHFLLSLLPSVKTQIHGMYIYFREGRNHAYFYAVYQATERAVRSTL